MQERPRHQRATSCPNRQFLSCLALVLHSQQQSLIDQHYSVKCVLRLLVLANLELHQGPIQQLQGSTHCPGP
jgi:hypothetical protein